jgi:two-component system sensor histidine kinase ComP
MKLSESRPLKMLPLGILRLFFKLSENERKNLSQDLHDAALQEQIIWYRKLEALSSDRNLPNGLREQLQQITDGLLDVIYEIRSTCNELRPPMLKETGLKTSILFDSMQLRTNYGIYFDACDFQDHLNEDLSIGIYRIVQELLHNATKHAKATEVHINLTSYLDHVRLVYEDNGVGMNLTSDEESFQSMGIYGIKERVRSMEGNIELRSSPEQGLVVFVSIPV